MARAKRGNPNQILRVRITDVRRQMGFFNRSTSNTEGLMKTVVNGRKGRKPVREVPTRWNSTLMALARYYSTAPFHSAYRLAKIALMKTAQRRAAKNPVTPILCKVVGQVVTVGMLVLKVTKNNEGNSSTLLLSGCDIVLLYDQLHAKQWLMPKSPDSSLAHGQADIAKYKVENPSATTVELDDVLFDAEELDFADLEPETRKLIEVYAEELRSRCFEEDLAKMKHILFNPAFLKQIVLMANGLALLKKLCRMAHIAESQAISAFDNGKELVLEMCSRLTGESLRAAVAACPPASQERLAAPGGMYAALDDDDEPEAAALPNPPLHPRMKDAAAKQELDHFLRAQLDKVRVNDASRWWDLELAKKEYPNLRLVAIAAYSAFPSSAESEREFSTAGKEATASRSSLRPAFLRILTFLCLNAQHLREVTKSDELIKTIPVLSPKECRAVQLKIEKMWAVDSDDEADVEPPPESE